MYVQVAHPVDVKKDNKNIKQIPNNIKKQYEIAINQYKVFANIEESNAKKHIKIKRKYN